ncbi:MAG TPA: DUF4058 family protein [Coleofasciculaceae cyanobacterium]
MPSPFPGMNPYLEAPRRWQEFHSRLIMAIADDLAPKLRPKYRAAVELRVYEDASDELTFIGKPDTTVFQGISSSEQIDSLLSDVATVKPVMVEVPLPEEIRERYLEIREVSSGDVVTTLELLSPSNKRPGKGRSQYEEKRLKILGSRTNLVEVDLIRSFKPLPVRGALKPSLYRILVSRSHQRPQAALYPFGLSDPIPAFPIPLKRDESEPIVDLQNLLHQVYDRAAYDLEIDYTQDPVLSLGYEDLIWVDQLLREKQLRL